MAKLTLNVSAKYALVLPVPENAIPVPISKWKAIMRGIGQCGKSTSGLHSIAWSAISIGVGFGIAAAALPFSAKFHEKVGDVDLINWPACITEWSFILAMLLGLGIGIVTLCYARLREKDGKSLADYLVDEMDEFEKRHPVAQLVTSISVDSSEQPASP